MSPHPILMQILHQDRNREVESALTQRQLRDDAEASSAVVSTVRTHPVERLVARIRQVFGMRFGVAGARV